MKNLRSVLAVMAFLAALPPASAGVFAVLPYNHPANDWVETVEPEIGEARHSPYNCGPFGITRYECGVVVLKGIHDLRALVPPGSTAQPADAYGQHVCDALWHLAVEFSKEVRVLGADPEAMLAAITRLRSTLGPVGARVVHGRISTPEIGRRSGCHVTVDGKPASDVGDDGSWWSRPLALGEHLLTIERSDGAPLAVYAVTVSLGQTVEPILTTAPPAPRP